MKNKVDKRFEKLKKERRFGLVDIDMNEVADWIMRPSEFYIEADGLPKDAIFMRAGYTFGRDTISLIYAHETFNKVPVGVEVPSLMVSYTRYSLIKVEKNG